MVLNHILPNAQIAILLFYQIWKGVLGDCEKSSVRIWFPRFRSSICLVQHLLWLRGWIMVIWMILLRSKVVHRESLTVEACRNWRNNTLLLLLKIAGVVTWRWSVILNFWLPRKIAHISQMLIGALLSKSASIVSNFVVWSTACHICIIQLDFLLDLLLSIKFNFGKFWLLVDLVYRVGRQRVVLILARTIFCLLITRNLNWIVLFVGEWTVKHGTSSRFRLRLIRIQ